jgi:hypothetical protein
MTSADNWLAFAVTNAREEFSGATSPIRAERSAEMMAENTSYHRRTEAEVSSESLAARQLVLRVLGATTSNVPTAMHVLLESFLDLAAGIILSDPPKYLVMTQRMLGAANAAVAAMDKALESDLPGANFAARES